MVELDTYARFLFGLIFVLALIGIVAWAAKRFGLIPGAVRMTPGRQKRLSIVEVAGIDAKRRLVLVRRDDVEHLILLGGTNETVVERGIATPESSISNNLQAASANPENQSPETT